jgi:putative ABC transport system permease protein
MSLTLAYNARYLMVRKASTALTIGGMALVVAVFTATFMLSNGLHETLAKGGSEQNSVVIQRGSQNEIQSGITRAQAGVILADDGVQREANNLPLSTSDVVVLVSLKKRDDNGPSNVTLRGTQAAASRIRDKVRLVSGRLPAPGTREALVGQAIFRKFKGTEPGQSIRLLGMEWLITGIFEADGSGYESEIWTDADLLMATTRRTQFSSLTFRIKPGTDFGAMKTRLENDKRLSMQVKTEKEFYADQSHALSLFINFVGSFVSIIFSLGAILGAMITMYSSVANRTQEIGTLRALGFTRSTVFAAFLKESLLLGLCGGLLGLVLASLLSFSKVSTTNFDTFAEVAFNFSLSPGIALQSLIFALLMGIIGGALPAFRAARLKIVDALRAD